MAWLRPLSFLDAYVLRRPFEGHSAARYARALRPAFGSLDRRLAETMAADLRAARSFVDVGAGTGAFAARVAAEHPALRVIAIEPSAFFTALAPTRDGIERRRARAEALPLADASVDVALCLTSLRHFADRGLALRELRRVVRAGGALWIVEIDADAPGSSVAAHTAPMPWLSSLTFRLVVKGACPPAASFAAEVALAGWNPASITRDPEQPFFALRAT